MHLVTSWLSWVALIAGALSVAYGIDGGYQGLESDFQDIAIGVFQLAVVAFAIGILVVGMRHREPLARTGWKRSARLAGRSPATPPRGSAQRRS